MDYNYLGFLCFILILVIFYWHTNKNYNFWSKRGIKGPKPKPFVGNLLEVIFTPKAYLEIKWFKKYGKIYGVFNGNQPILTLAEPELIKKILVKDFHIFTDKLVKPKNHPILSKNLPWVSGDDWKRIRSIVSPTFTSGKMKKMYPMVGKCLDEFLNTLESYATNEKVVDIKEMFGNLTMDTIASCAFATKTNSHKDPNNPFIQNAHKVFVPKIYRLALTLILPKYLLKFLNIYSVIEESANKFFFDLTRHLISERKTSNEKYNDFIQLLMNAQKNESIDTFDENESNDSYHFNRAEDELSIERNAFSNVNKFLTEEEILGQAWVFLTAGYETTGTTLSFTAYELAMNPQKQQKLYEELSTAFGSNGEVDYDLLSKLPYLDSVLSETLRLHSPVLRLMRIASQDYKLGDTGIILYKGQTVEIPIYAMHRSEEFFDNPLQFIPERFLPENRHKIIAYSYLPFAAGPRNCIGMRFALMEAKYCLAKLILSFELNRSHKTAVPLRLTHNHLLASPKDVILSINKRQII